MIIEKITDAALLKKMLQASYAHKDRLDLDKESAKSEELDLDILRIKMRLEEIDPQAVDFERNES